MNRDGRQESVAELLVNWQHPLAGEVLPIGILAYDGVRYWFRYTQYVLEVPDFRSLPGLEDLCRTYVTDRLPAVFAERVTASSLLTPWEQLVAGGRREGDSLYFTPYTVDVQAIDVV